MKIVVDRLPQKEEDCLFCIKHVAYFRNNFVNDIKDYRCSLDVKRGCHMPCKVSECDKLIAR